MKPMKCAAIALVPEAGTDRVWLEIAGAGGERLRAGLSPAHVSALHQHSRAAFAARNPAPKPAATAEKPAESA